MVDATCSVDGCTALAKRRGWCGKHYQRWWKHGDPLGRPIATSCQVDGCERPPRAKHTPLCEMHYYRVRRGTDLTAPVRPRNETGVCLVEGCPTSTPGMYCPMHYARIYRHGDPHALHYVRRSGADNPCWKGDDVGYAVVHQRLRSHRGAPTSCAHCGSSDSLNTYQWAFNWLEASELRVDQATGYQYSTNLDDYVSLCIYCHWRFDRSASRSAQAATTRQSRSDAH